MESTTEKRRSRTYRIIALILSLAIHLGIGFYLWSGGNLLETDSDEPTSFVVKQGRGSK